MTWLGERVVWARAGIRKGNSLSERDRCLYPKCLALEVDKGFASRRVTRVLETIIAGRGKPQAIQCENGPGPDQPAFPGLGFGVAS
jgi:hypothetical protein